MRRSGLFVVGEEGGIWGGEETKSAFEREVATAGLLLVDTKSRRDKRATGFVRAC